MIDTRDTKIKRVGNKVYVEFYEDNRMIGLIDYSDKSLYYVEDAIENFISGIMTTETIDRYKEPGNVV
tara:strand:+ start:386 stop:589 length:204 start_codon:yes stop_codon:yes gene_type:complete